MPRSKRLTVLSWNVNGIRAVSKKGFLGWLAESSPDVIGLQETRASADVLGPEILNPPGYESHWVSGERKGYSGVAVLSRIKPLEVRTGFGRSEYDSEGRVITAEFPEYTFVNAYFPNGGMGDHRVRYKLAFCDAMFEYCAGLRKKGKKLVVAGDYNTAHKPIDLAEPEPNADVSGFLPEERAWIDKFIAAGFIDTFREFNSEGGHYTWWDQRRRARQTNAGWRIDYHFISSDLRQNLKDAFILSQVRGSDHCPVGITLAF